MTKQEKIYRIFMTSMIVIIAGLLLATGIIAVQKSMKLSAGVSITPSMLCKITDSSNNVLFCNTTKNSQSLYVTEGASISGNMLTLNKSFSNLGGEFALKIYNYTTVATSGNVIKVTASGTGVETTSMWLPSYSSGTPTAGEINVTAVAGLITLQFEEVAKPSFTVTYNLTDCTSNKTSGASVTYGTSYSATITPTTGYSLPSTITVADISTGGYSWDYLTGVFTITDWTKVNGNITITAAAALPYTIIGKYTLDNLNNKSGATWIDDSISFTSGSTTLTYNLYNSALANYYYLEMGNYEQDNTGSAEKVRWLVLGMPIGETSNGVFTANNNGVLNSTSSYIPFVNSTNGSTSLGGWKYDETSNKFQYHDGSTWLDCPQVLVISDMALINQAFDSSYSGNAWNVDGRIEDFINGSDGASGLYGEIFTTDAQKNRILKTFIKTTSYYDGSIKNAEGDSGNSYKMFLLGNDDYSGYNATESYALEDIFNVDATTGCHEVRAMATLYAKAQGASVYQITIDSYKQYNGSSYWYLRSGRYNNHRNAYLLDYNGSVGINIVSSSVGVVRPSFVLNLA